jgi:hypothetical protein
VKAVTTKVWLLGLAALPLVACKAKPGTVAPARDVRSWTVGEIEAELDRNDRVLADEGVMIAMASPVVPNEPAVAPTTEPGADPEADPTPTEEPGDTNPEVAGQPQPETPTSAPPTPTIEPSPAYEGELYADEGPKNATTAQRREGRRARLGSRSSRRDADTRCERVCELAEATCELETQICELAERHPDEPRYEQACLRAEQQCLAASQACDRCVD